MGRVDAALTCLPHATAAPVVAALRKGGVTVIDISADFRLRDPAVYEEWYGPHGAPELFGGAVYGLPEVYASEIAGAELVAAPGCYPTSALLPMLRSFGPAWSKRRPSSWMRSRVFRGPAARWPTRT